MNAASMQSVKICLDRRKIIFPHRHRRILEQVAIPRLALSQFFFGIMLIAGEFNRNMQMRLIEGLQQVADRPGGLRALKRLCVVAGGREDDGRIMNAADRLCRFDAIHRPFEPNVHQNQVRGNSSGHADRPFARFSNRRRLIAQMFQLALNAFRKRGIVFNNKYLFSREVLHLCPSAIPSLGIEMCFQNGRTEC